MNFRRLGLVCGASVCVAAAIGCGGPDARSAEKETPASSLTPPPVRGGQAPAFSALTMDGQPINFPSEYQGKLVMLDFWSTWCGPCMEEVPNIVKNYQEFQPRGFEILGITFDHAGDQGIVRNVASRQKMAWPQIFIADNEGATIEKKYVVGSIPFAVLIDGNTGKVLAAGDELRGGGLTKIVKAELDKMSRAIAPVAQ